MKLNVGCGAHRREGWFNIDLRPFDGVDAVRDATLPFADLAPLEAVYAEHFLEHLPLPGAFAFLRNAAEALAPGGVLRLSTPGLEWVSVTHFDAAGSERSVVEQTLGMNRAFHGWGHRFLWSRPFLARTLTAVGFETTTWFNYGESSTPELAGLERHGGWRVDKGWPSVWIAEAVRPETLPALDDAFLAHAHEAFQRHVDAGH